MVTAKLISVFVFANWIVQSFFYLDPTFKPLAIFLVSTAWFVSDLVGDPDDSFSQNEAQILLYQKNLSTLSPNVLIGQAHCRGAESNWIMWSPFVVVVVVVDLHR